MRAVVAVRTRANQALNVASTSTFWRLASWLGPLLVGRPLLLVPELLPLLRVVVEELEVGVVEERKPELGRLLLGLELGDVCKDLKGEDKGQKKTTVSASKGTHAPLAGSAARS